MYIISTRKQSRKQWVARAQEWLITYPIALFKGCNTPSRESLAVRPPSEKPPPDTMAQTVVKHACSTYDRQKQAQHQTTGAELPLVGGVQPPQE
jgi:hypothetical protein